MPIPSRWLRTAFFGLLVLPLVHLLLGLRIEGADRLPRRGPALVVANHNSHLDTLVLMSLFGLGRLPRIRAVAAADYWLRGRLRAWFAMRIIGIVPLERSSDDQRTLEQRMALVSRELEAGQVVVYFPEGTRGKAGDMQRFRAGIGHLAALHPQVPVVPVYLSGLERSLPRGESLIVPHSCRAAVGRAHLYSGDPRHFAHQLEGSVRALAKQSA